MAAKTKCSGCKMFTQCLGCVRDFITAGPIEKCMYCRSYFIGKTMFPHETFCEEFHLVVKEFYLEYVDYNRSCQPCDFERRQQAFKESLGM